ncbi:MAG: SEL1-like repeat protein [Akkermansia sp.]|nr:SEL1-like repeat protein [Akkermansia sp.]
MNTNHFALPANVELGNYRILRTLGQGGFGITYLAEDINDGKQVVIKENLPTFCAYRNTTSLLVASANPNDEAEEYRKLLTRFVDEARLLASLNHPNIVKVYTAFEALGTAYYVMPWVGGQELQKVAPAPQEITEAWLLPILRKLLEALEYLHSQNIYHRDIKPANILLENETTPVIIDFGTARSIISDRSATMVGSPGYSPIEQITARGQRGPWTDVYSLGATCYRLITGSPPPEANERLADDEDPLRPLINQAELRGRFSLEFLATIDKALALRAKNRWQTAGEWLASLPMVSSPLIAVNTSLPASALPKIVNTRPINVAQSTSKKKLLLFIPLLVLLIGGLSAGRYMIVLKMRENRERQQLEAAAQQQAEINEHYQKGEGYYYGRDGHEQNYETAAHHLRIAAMAGHAEAQYSFGVCYENGQGVSKNLNEAVNWYQKAAEQGLAAAQCALGSCYENGRGIIQDTNEATNWYRKAAEQGHAEAQFNLALSYDSGNGITQNSKEAANWFRKAAEQGHAKAQNHLAVCYLTGSGVTKDTSEAAQWFRKAAEQGHAEAQCSLGTLYANGHGVTEDYSEAVTWFRKAAEQGLPQAQCSLGFCYGKARGVTLNYYKAIDWHKKAANQGYATAQCTVGLCYAYGHGVTQDYSEAMNWFRKAANQGHKVAQYCLGVCYANGHGVSRDYSEAVTWFRKAANQGHAEAQYNLGLCYESGKGVSQDDNEAASWFQKAADQGHEAAKLH